MINKEVSLAIKVYKDNYAAAVKAGREVAKELFEKEKIITDLKEQIKQLSGNSELGILDKIPSCHPTGYVRKEPPSKLKESLLMEAEQPDPVESNQANSQ